MNPRAVAMALSGLAIMPLGFLFFQNEMPILCVLDFALSFLLLWQGLKVNAEVQDEPHDEG